ncbi:MAG: hypothetical protein PHO79_03800 [Desulfoplanes sp.]|nr:hypothetical protein [Desulfoplanes sp.]
MGIPVTIASQAVAWVGFGMMWHCKGAERIYLLGPFFLFEFWSLSQKATQTIRNG